MPKTNRTPRRDTKDWSDYLSVPQIVALGKSKGLPVSYKKVRKAVRLEHLTVEVDDYTVDSLHRPRFYIHRNQAEEWLSKLLKPCKVGDMI